MKITPNRVGATIDVTNEALAQVLELLAPAYAANETLISALLLGVADSIEKRDELIENPGVDRPVDVIESADDELAGAMKALVSKLPKVPISFRLATTDCRADAVQLLKAADESVTAESTARRAVIRLSVPRQQDRRHAA